MFPPSSGIYPIQMLRPKYKALGAPVPVVPIPGVDDNPDLGPRTDAEGAASGFEAYPIYYGSGGNGGLLENFNVRTLYDKLEDQTLHIASQLARHQSDLRGFYDRISQQTEGLKNMLDNLDVSAIAKAMEQAERSRKKDEDEGEEKEHDGTVSNSHCFYCF